MGSPERSCLRVAVRDHVGRKVERQRRPRLIDDRDPWRLLGYFLGFSLDVQKVVIQKITP